MSGKKYIAAIVKKLREQRLEEEAAFGAPRDPWTDGYLKALEDVLLEFWSAHDPH